jgi:hypothetical protein
MCADHANSAIPFADIVRSYWWQDNRRSAIPFADCVRSNREQDHCRSAGMREYP